MRHTVRMAVEAGVSIGAHPGFPDLAGFGRREMSIEPRDIADLVLYQIGALSAIAKAEGASLRHVKPHGALYNMSVRRADIAEAIARAVASFDDTLVLVGLPGRSCCRRARALGLRVAAEAFADRSYEPDGSLTPRHLADAVLSEPGAASPSARSEWCATARLRRATARRCRSQVDTICVHGDTPAAAELAAAVRIGLEAGGHTS